MQIYNLYPQFRHQDVSAEEMQNLSPEEKHLVFLFEELVAPTPVYRLECQ